MVKMWEQTGSKLPSFKKKFVISGCASTVLSASDKHSPFLAICRHCRLFHSVVFPSLFVCLFRGEMPVFEEATTSKPRATKISSSNLLIFFLLNDALQFHENSTKNNNTSG